MKKLCALFVGLTFLLVFTSNIWAVISKKCGRTCGGELTITQGSSSVFDIQGLGVDFARSVSVSNTSAISATIVRKWNGAENVRDFDERSQCPGKAEWGRIQIRVSATMSAPFLHFVYINYPAGRDRFTVKVVRKAVITGVQIPTFTEPISGNVDIKFTGTGLSGAHATNNNFYTKVDPNTPCLDASGQNVLSNNKPVPAFVNTATNTDSQVDVRLTFPSDWPRLIEVTLNATLRGSGECNGYPASYTFKLKAPRSGPNYVASHNYCVPNQTCTTTFMLNATICVTIRLDRAVPGRCLAAMDRLTGKVTPCGEIVYWTVSDRSAIQSDGATPYNPLALNNTIWIPNGQQEKRICFIGIKGSPQGITSKFITWKPDPNTDTFPNRRESSFTIKSQ